LTYFRDRERHHEETDCISKLVSHGKENQNAKKGKEGSSRAHQKGRESDIWRELRLLSRRGGGKWRRATLGEPIKKKKRRKRERVRGVKGRQVDACAGSRKKQTQANECLAQVWVRSRASC